MGIGKKSQEGDFIRIGAEGFVRLAYKGQVIALLI